MPPDAAAEARLDAEAESDVAAGRVVPQGRVREWLKRLANGEKVPPPTALFVQVTWTANGSAGRLARLRIHLRFQPQAAIRMADALRAAGESLARFPHRGRPVRGTAMLSWSRSAPTSHGG
jgi:plasmid stabilization system protein ParE